MNYEQDVEIDENVLDVECLGQAVLMMKYCRHSAKCEKERDLSKEALGLVKAESDSQIRSSAPEKYRLEKFTEGAISAIILKDKKYQDANEDYLNKCFEFNVASGAVKAVDQRKKMLELLVQLHGQQYFAGPKIPHNLSEQRALKEKERERSNQIQSGVASKMKRSR
jgi:hypothetical protein